MYVATVYMKHKGRNILSGYEKCNLYEKEYCVEHGIAKTKVFIQFTPHYTTKILTLPQNYSRIQHTSCESFYQ